MDCYGGKANIRCFRAFDSEKEILKQHIKERLTGFIPSLTSFLISFFCIIVAFESIENIAQGIEDNRIPIFIIRFQALDLLKSLTGIFVAFESIEDKTLAQVPIDLIWGETNSLLESSERCRVAPELFKNKTFKIVVIRISRVYFNS